MNEPQTPREWQEAMNAAHAVVVLEGARRLGMLNGGPTVDLERCADILTRAKALGLTADPLAAHEFLNQIGAAPEVHQLLVRLGNIADGGLFVGALIDTPVRDYALDVFGPIDA